MQKKRSINTDQKTTKKIKQIFANENLKKQC